MKIINHTPELLSRKENEDFQGSNSMIHSFFSKDLSSFMYEIAAMSQDTHYWPSFELYVQKEDIILNQWK